MALFATLDDDRPHKHGLKAPDYNISGGENELKRIEEAGA